MLILDQSEQHLQSNFTSVLDNKVLAISTILNYADCNFYAQINGKIN